MRGLGMAPSSLPISSLPPCGLDAAASPSPCTPCESCLCIFYTRGFHTFFLAAQPSYRCTLQ